jgi:nucleotide-binding universal stress UspA family protein
MTQRKCILCPVDFSEFSRHALDCAVRLARWNKARLIAIHVLVNWPAVDVVPSLRNDRWPRISLKDVDRSALMRCLRDFVNVHANEPVEIDLRVVEAPDVHREILTQADTLHVGLIVIGSHGRSGFERLLLGSTTEKVLRGARCPVMVVPRGAQRAGAVSARPFRGILCPVDFSCGAIAALTSASELARKARAELTVLHVIDIPAVLFETPGFDVSSYRSGVEAEARHRLCDVMSARTVERTNVIVAEGRPDQEILRAAAAREIDLIVMGVHGRHAVDLAVFGSTTHRVIRGASCPVLTIRREEGAS